MKRIGVAINNAKSRLSRYAMVGRWLLTLGFKHAPMPMIVVPFLSTAAVGLQILSFMSIARYLGQLQPAGAQGMPDIETKFGMLNPFVFIAGVVLLLAAAGLAHFGATRLSIQAYRNVAVEITGDLLQKIRSLTDPVEKWRLMRSFGQQDILRVASSDGNMCGMTVRILLDNTINLFFLIAGVVIFLWYSPALVVGLLGVFAVCALLAYPMNIRTISLANTLESAQTGRAGRIQRTVEATLKPISDMSIDLPKLLAAEAGGIIATSTRFVMSETFRLLLALIFAFVIGGALWLISIDAGKKFLDTHVLVNLFFAFRFAYHGLQGLLICLMNLNRFMPSLLRAESVFRAIERARLPAAPAADRSGGPQRFAWRLGEAAIGQTTGTFEPGKLYVVTERANVPPDLLYRLFSILDKDQAAFGQLYLSGQIRSPQTASGAAPAAWTGGVLAALDGSSAAEKGEAAQPLLDAIDERRRAGSQIIVINQTDIVQWPHKALELLQAALATSIVLVTGPWHAAIGPGMANISILVSNGTAVGFAGDSAAMTALDWEQAQAVYNGGAGAEAAAKDEPLIIDELEEGLI